MKTRVLVMMIMLAAGAIAGEEKIRLLVDKVFSRGAPSMSRQDFTALKEAGFNVVCDRKFGDKPEQIAAYLDICRSLDLKYVPWLRGTVESRRPEGQLVFENGVRLPVAAPLSPELWNYLHDIILKYARMSKAHSNLPGIFLDFEMYYQPMYIHAYPISYDDDTWRTFFVRNSLPVANVVFVERRNYLEQRKLDEKYRKLFIAEFRRHCKELRAEIDKINPEFQFFVYGGDLLVTNEFIPAMHTARAPVVHALSNTYAPPCPLLPDEDNIIMVKELLEEERREKGKDVIILAGLDPAVPGCSPEYAAKTGTAAAETVDGYWVFYEGFTKDSPRHAQYIKEFTRGNEAIVNKKYDYAREPFRQSGSKEVIYRKRSGELPLVGLWGGVYGGNKHLHKTLEGKYETHDLESLSEDYIRNFDILFLQNLNALAPDDSKLRNMLREYVAAGGRLLLAHDTGWYMYNLFPEIAGRRYPVKNVAAVRHVMDTRMITANGGEYNSAFPDHIIFQLAPGGKSLVKNAFGEDVIVIGSHKKGKVAFCGNFFAHRSELTGTEKEILLNVMEYLK